jgi:hypothetical protein
VIMAGRRARAAPCERKAGFDLCDASHDVLGVTAPAWTIARNGARGGVRQMEDAHWHRRSERNFSSGLVDGEVAQARLAVPDASVLVAAWKPAAAEEAVGLGKGGGYWCSTTPPLHHSTTPPLHHSTTPPLQSITEMARRSDRLNPSRTISAIEPGVAHSFGGELPSLSRLPFSLPFFRSQARSDRPRHDAEGGTAPRPLQFQRKGWSGLAPCKHCNGHTPAQGFGHHPCRRVAGRRCVPPGASQRALLPGEAHGIRTGLPRDHEPTAVSPHPSESAALSGALVERFSRLDLNQGDDVQILHPAPVFGGFVRR